MLPKATVNTIHYRENIDNLRFQKTPGLVKFEPVTFKRGATQSLDLYNWYRTVNDDTLLTGVAQELSSSTTAPPAMSEYFRKEIMIDLLDREGSSVRQWILFNAFPIAYKGGNDLSAQAEEILVEEITFDYEYFLETTGGVSGLAKQAAQDAVNGTVGALAPIAGIG